jgi:V/A-type H+-transporting ATPase subunit E
MAEELQGLLEKIQKDGVEKAQAEASAITDAARTKASEIIVEAEKQAVDLIEAAKQDAAQFETRARNSLLQAARDLVITVGQNVTALLERLLADRVRSEFSGAALSEAITHAVKAYIETGTQAGDLAVLLSETEKAAVEGGLNEALKEALDQGLELTSVSSVVAGFKVSLEGGKLVHDFSDTAVADALAGLLRPALAEIVRASASQESPAGH